MRPGECHILQSEHANQASSLDSTSQNATSAARTLPFHQTHDAPEESTTTRDDAAQTQTTHQSTVPTLVHRSSLEHNFSANDKTLGVDVGVIIVSSDIWSTAYREAVESLGKDIDVAILEGENVAQLFRQLEEIDKEADQESLFLRGVKYLKSLQVPLEKFKLALDVAAPLANMDPTATIVFGVVRSVTAVSSFHRNLTPYSLCRSDYIRTLTCTYTDRHQPCNC